MSGTLYVVGTTIGNLKDVSAKVGETLNGVEVIACEDWKGQETVLYSD